VLPNFGDTALDLIYEADIMAFHADVARPAVRPLPNAEKRDNRMLRRSVLISWWMLGDTDAERDYTEILLRDSEESSVNRGFHREYYGDVPFESASAFSYCCGIGNVVDAPSLTDRRCAAAFT
jgi:hypothetical protein